MKGHLPLALVAALCTAAAGARAQEVTEPGSGVRFPAHDGEKTLLGVGLRSRTILKVKVYAIALYVADSALAGPLAGHKGRTASPAFAKAVVEGDFPKEVRLRLTRDLTAEQIQGAMREALRKAEPTRLQQFVSYFPALKTGDEIVLRALPGGTLETIMVGQEKPAIADRTFTQAVFGVWLGEEPVQEEIKKGLVSRAEGVLK
jgi:Chalcone isomerase-like